MKATDYFKRYEGILDWAALKTKRVLIIGAGSVGAPLAEELVRLSASVTLVDFPRERFKTHNIVRHIVGRSALGRLKLDAVVAHIRGLHPNACLTALAMDVVKDRERLRDHVAESKPDLIVVATDNQESRFCVDAIARVSGIPAIGGGLYDGAIGGLVYRTDDRTPCYACISDTLRGDGYGTQSRERSVNYENPDWNEFRSTQALRLDILLMTTLFGRWALQTLLKNSDTPDLGIPSEANVLLYAIRRVPGLFKEPLRATFVQIPARPDCLLCGSGDQNLTGTSLPEIPNIQDCPAVMNIKDLEP